MSGSCRRTLFILLSLAAMTTFATAAFAQDCDTYCNPYFTYCSDSCDKCIHQGIDGCDGWTSSTCGDERGACLADNCTPNWSETYRSNVGTYDGVSFSHCNHHKVDSVTLTDSNHCNVNEYYYSYSYCDDYIDDYKNNCCYPSCCSGYGENGHYLTCNGYHSCS
jgi:hypothetical protein